jgi:ATP adenylyltransferase
LAYVSSASGPDGGCVFCAAGRVDEASGNSLVVHRGRQAYVILNLYPYNNGHLMVVPVRHIASLGEATADERSELMTLTALSEAVLMEAYAPHGLNVGINLGRAAGAGVEHHLHVHLVPRWSGDTNFMTTVGDVRVLPESMDEVASRLRPVFARLGTERG